MLGSETAYPLPEIAYTLEPMSGADVRFVRRDESFVVLGSGSFTYNGAGELGGPLSIIGPASIASLVRAVRAAETYFGGDATEPLSIWVSEVAPEDFDEDYSPITNVGFEVKSSEFAVVVHAPMVDGSIDDPQLSRLISSFLHQRGCKLKNAEGEGSGSHGWWHVRFWVRTRGRTLAGAYAIGSDLDSFLGALNGLGLTMDGAAELIRAGKADVLVGLPESPWLEAKMAGYSLKDLGEKIKLARAVTGFANAEQGGLLVLGLRTRKSPDGDVISQVTPIPSANLRVRQYRRAIDQLVHPPIDHLQIERIATDSSRALLLITVPRQPERLKPFLVHGALIGETTEGAFISIVRRRGEDSIPITPEAIHTMIVAGRSILIDSEIR